MEKENNEKFDIIEVILGLKNPVPTTSNEIPMYKKTGVSTAIAACPIVISKAPITIYFIPSAFTLKLFLVIKITGIIKILDRKNLQKARIEDEQYCDRILPFVQDNPHVAIVIHNEIICITILSFN